MANLSRRSFLKTGAAAFAGFTIAPNIILGKSHGHAAPTDKLNIAAVGVGGRGASVLRGMEAENIVAIADVDWGYAKPVMDRYPNAKKFKDYRQMYSEMGNSIDAVMVATADHTHAIIAAEAITMGKHVYVEKPLTHSIYEARLLKKLAEKYGVATQMGNQGSSGEGTRKVIQWVQNGEIGTVTKVEASTNRPIWPQGLNRPTKVDKVPKTLDWNLFLGPAKFRDFNSVYHPWNWRGWWDFGTGALGDMACHILHGVYEALQLGYPTQIQGSSTALLTDCAPSAQSIRMVFPARPNLPKQAMPQVEVTWYDGGLKPMRPEGMPKGKELEVAGGCTILHGTKDTLIYGCYGRDPWLLSGRVPTYTPGNHETTENEHQTDWIRACKENAATRMKSWSDFSRSAGLTEMVDIGVLATRLQGLNQVLDWDGENMKLTNIDPNATVRIMKASNFSVNDGHPTFNNEYAEPVNALEFANELIKHTYQNGYKLPDMPR